MTVKSLIESKLEYSEDKTIDVDDIHYSTSIYDYNLFNENVEIALGKGKENSNDYNIVYYSIYLIYNSELKSRIGVFEAKGEHIVELIDENGNVDEVVALGGPGTGKQNYCRVPKNTYHMLIVDSEYMLVKETTSGPFSRSDTKFPVWAEDYPARREARPYIESLEKQIGVKFG